MGMLSGAMTVRRFRVEGEVPDAFRDRWREALNDYAFREPMVEMGKEEVEGWVQVHNLLDTDFSDLNRWLYNNYAVFALRVDKKTLPAKLFAATLQKRCEAWCEEQGVERCPTNVKKTLKEQLEEEWMARTLPRVAVTECAWNIDERWLVLHSLSDTLADRFRKRFLQTFGLTLVPWSPLDWVAGDAAMVDDLLDTAPSVAPVEAA